MNSFRGGGTGNSSSSMLEVESTGDEVMNEMMEGIE